MKASEFRVGNILQYFIGEDGCEWEQTTLDWQDIRWATLFNENFNKVHQPIPLTEEWLLKFGFEETGRNTYTLPDAFNYGLHVRFLMGKFSIKHRANRGYEKIINYVHELQNIYYSMIDYELIPKPSASHQQ